MRNFLKEVPGLVSLVRFLRGAPQVLPHERVLAAMPENSVGLEIGVHKGDFSEQIIREVNPRELHLVDPWVHIDQSEYEQAWYGGGNLSQEDMGQRYRRVTRRFEARIERGQVHIHRMTSAEAASQFEDSYFGWIYIDGNHLFEHVIQDLKIYYPKLKRGEDYEG